MTKGLRGRISGILVGSLCGYIIGWALGWSLFDPNLDLWALGAMVGALLGLIMGVLPGFWKWGGVLLCSTFCLYIGWVLRTLIFGDFPGGVGALLILGGVIIGAIIGRQRMFQEDGPALRALTLGLVVGFFGGFLIDWIVMRNLGILSEEPPIIIHAPAVTFSGLVGIVMGVLSGKSKRGVKGEE